mmetsp:Transcript_33600/g.62975  ORF Transcript_33600/g.62975 Transcript_33600/m.62975 type:complete len:246 (+) Transcript_33600:92-829(+)
MAPSVFEEHCRQRNVQPDDLRTKLLMPVVANKRFVEMTDNELQEQNRRVRDQSNELKRERALFALERAQDGRLERRATKVWTQHAREVGNVSVSQVPAMLDALTYDVSTNEVHFLLSTVGATKGSESIPQQELTQQDWCAIVGECHLLKESFKFFRREEWEAHYADYMRKLSLKELWTLERKGNKGDAKIGWWWTTGEKAFQVGALQRFAWGTQPEIEEELLGQMELLIGPRLKDAPDAVQASME